VASVLSLGQMLIDDAAPVAAAWVERLRAASVPAFRQDADEELEAQCREQVRALGRYLVSRDDRGVRELARREAEKRFRAGVRLDDLVAAYRSLQDLLWDRSTDGPAGPGPELGLWDLSGGIIMSIEESVAAYQALLSRQLAGRSRDGRPPGSPAPAVPAPAAVDEITGLFSARVFHEYLPREIRRAQRYGRAVALVLFDIDDFGRIVDRCGTDEAERVAGELAALVPQRVREVDLMCRLDSDMFAVILPETAVAAAGGVAERIRTAAETHPGFAADARASGAVRVSAGVAGFPDDAETAEQLLARAEAACARAKRLGKNQVVAFADTRA
jgi:diguanylate cyclase (GGDEF)-like protein